MSKQRQILFQSFNVIILFRSLLNALGCVWDTSGETSESATAKSRIETSKIDSLPDQPGEIIDVCP